MQDADGKELKWETLEHSGVLFPPEFKAHGVKMLYDGAPVELTAAQEEVATMAASMVETDYFSKDTFLKNFWEGFKKVGAWCGAAVSCARGGAGPVWEKVDSVCQKGGCALLCRGCLLT